MRCRTAVGPGGERIISQPLSVAGVMAAAGVIVFSKNCWEIKDQTLSWAFVFNAVSCGMSLLAGPVIILDSLLQKS